MDSEIILQYDITQINQEAWAKPMTKCIKLAM